jgi:hypothetical protein
MKTVAVSLLSFFWMVCITWPARNVTSKELLSFQGAQTSKPPSVDEKERRIKAALEEYTGTFDFTDFQSLAISVEKGALYAQTSQGKSVLKKAERKDKFEIVDYQATLQFNRDESRKIRSVELNAQGFSSTGIKR